MIVMPHAARSSRTDIERRVFPQRMGGHKDWAHRAFRVMARNVPYTVQQVAELLQDRHARAPAGYIDHKHQWSLGNIGPADLHHYLRRSGRFKIETKDGLTLYSVVHKISYMNEYNEGPMKIVLDIVVLATGTVSVTHHLKLNKSEHKWGWSTCRNPACRKKAPTKDAIIVKHDRFCSEECHSARKAVVFSKIKKLTWAEWKERQIWKGYAQIMKI